MGYRCYTRVYDKAVSNALVDLDTVKEELGIAEGDTTKDTILDREIKQISAAVTSHCGRAFKAEGLIDTFVWEHRGYGYGGSGAQELSLSRYPLAGFLLSLTTADTTSGSVLPIEDTSAAADGVIISGPNITAGAKVTAADETTVTLSNAITGTIPAGTIIAFGLEVTACPGSSVRVLAPGRDYLIDETAGLLTRAHYGAICRWGGETIAVRYRGGYVDDDIPPDVQMAVLRWITMRYTGHDRDPMLKAIEEPGIGRKEFWVGGPQMSGAVPDEIAGILDTYRMIG